MRFQLFGPLAVSDEAGPVEIPGPLARAILAVLLLEAGSPVSAERLIAELWGERPPRSATASLYNHVGRLRGYLRGAGGGERIKTVSPGYLIEVEPGELDTASFAGHCARGQRALRGADWRTAADEFSAALGLWRGDPLADVPELPGYRVLLDQFEESRIQALEGRIEAELELGRHREVVQELRGLAAAHPLREPLHGQLMLALYRAGRQAESLEAYQALREHLTEELGVEPGRPLKDLHVRILNGDPALARAAAEDSAPAVRGGRGGRFQLPADNRLFTGRADELARLLELARLAPTGNDAGMVVVSALDGLGGVGKTALAVRAAHLLRSRFPDGQLFLDLLGHTPGLEPLTVGEALDRLLRALGSEPEDIPPDLGKRAAYYRHLLAGTRTLIILDNAADAAQVRALLPSEPGCLALITSRRRLTGLDEAAALSLDVLPAAYAAELLLKAAGPGRVAADQPGLDELIELCGCLPLAIRIVGARLRHHRSLAFEDLLSDLRDESARLTLLEVEGEGADDEEQDGGRYGLPAVFSSSYEALPEAEQRMFRLLSLVPGSDFEAYAAAGLAAVGLREAERLLESLLDHSLLVQHTPGRYRFHDLVRVFASATAARQRAQTPDHELALHRLFDYYEYCAVTADARLAEYTRVIRRTVSPEVAPSIESWTDAITWTRAERENLVAAIRYAAGHGLPVRAITLSSGLASFLDQDGPLDQAAELHRAALGLAQDLEDRAPRAEKLMDLGRSLFAAGSLASAVEHFEQALPVYRELGDRPGEAECLFQLGRARYAATSYPGSREALDQSLALHRELGDRRGEANTLVLLGRLGFMTEGPRIARERCQTALEIYRELGQRRGEADAMHQIATTWIVEGPAMAALEPLRQALALRRELGNRRGEANLLWELGRMWVNAGRYAEAAEPIEQALELYRRLGQRRGEALALNLGGYSSFLTADYPRATELFERAGAILAELGDRPAAAMATEFLGRVAGATGEHRRGITLIREAEAVYRELGLARRVAYALELQVPIFVALGERTTAEELLSETLKIYRGVNSPAGEAQTLNTLGDLLIETGRVAQASDSYRGALEKAREAENDEEEKRALAGIERCAAQPRTGSRS